MPTGDSLIMALSSQSHVSQTLPRTHPCQTLVPDDASSLAAPTPGSSWGTTKRPCCGCGAKNEARSSRRTSRATSSSSSGVATEDLNRRWYEANSGHVIADVQRRVRHPTVRWMGATLDGRVEATGAVFEAKFMLPWSFSEQAAAEKHMAQLQHNMWVTNSRLAALSVITGGGKWVEIKITADSLYQHLLLTAEKKFWRCVESGEPPRLFGVEPPRARIEAVRIVDMSSSNAWAEFSTVFRRTREAYLEHENAKTELKALMPEDAKEAIGHGVRGRRSRSGAVSFDVLATEAVHAPLQ